MAEATPGATPAATPAATPEATGVTQPSPCWPAFLRLAKWSWDPHSLLKD